MPNWETTPGIVKAPAGYESVALAPEQLACPLRICVLTKPQPDPAAGHFIVLRDTLDAQVLLGCVCDQAGTIHRWIEVWIQNIDGLADVAPACVEALSNDALDRRWIAHVEAFEQAMPGNLMRAGWDREHGSPLFIDLASLAPTALTDSDTGHAWQLCRDDPLLIRRGLPAYSTSLHRYLFLPNKGEETSFIPATRSAPTNDATVPLEQVIGRRKLVAVNAGAGLMMIRPHSDIGLEHYIDILSGAQHRGVAHGQHHLDPEGVAATASGDVDSRLPGDGRLFLGAHGRSGRLVETYHLKLRLLAEAVRQVRAVSQAAQKPFLNLSPDSFHVTFNGMDAALPFLWTARLALVDPGDAVALPVRAGDADYYLPGSSASSIYRPGSASAPATGNGSFRIRQVLDGTEGMTVLEGTFSTHERVTVARNDLVWFRLALKSGRVDLHGRLEQESAMASGEWRFRTIGQRLDIETVRSLRAAEGIQMNTRFEVIPLLSTPCDLYALAVLAVRMLLVNPRMRLAVALDETLSLARQAAQLPEGELARRVEQVFEADSRFRESLGPHRLCREEIAAVEAFDLVPDDLWWATLAMIIRMFPAAGRDSSRADYGDAPHGGIHRVFDPVLDELDRLIVRSRSLIVIDWRFNREIHSVIRRHLVT